MVTTVPAELAGSDTSIGSVATGFYADLLLIRKTGKDPYEALLHLEAADVRLVMVGGVPIYGDRDLMQQLLPGKQLELVAICGATKVLYIEPAENPDSQKGLKQISDELQAKLATLGTSLAELAPCKD